jgi:PD-(D/E)XK nuclease superfamily
VTVQAIMIAPISATSPTLAEDMRLCGLRAALSARAIADRWVLHDPRVWLGIAFHRLVERVRRGLRQEDLISAWDEVIERLVKTARDHPLDRRYAAPEEWPGYQLARIRSMRSAGEMMDRAKSAGGKRPSQARTLSVEHRLSARSGELVGRPDEFTSTRVTDYKLSLPLDGSPVRNAVIARYKRQLQIYAAIIAEAKGEWVREGVIKSGSGQSLSFELIPAVCDREADAAVALLHDWRRKFEAGPLGIANPGPEQCGECQFQSMCPAFWELLRKGDIDIPSPRVAAIGDLISAQPGNDPDITTLIFRSLASTGGQLTTPAMVIRKSIHGSAFLDAVGGPVRISNAILRSDRRLRADHDTVLLAESQAPALVPAAAAEPEGAE